MMNTIDQPFDQPSFDKYAKMESQLRPLIHRANLKSLSLWKQLNSDVNISMLTAQMEILQVLLKDSDCLCFDDIIVKIK